MRPPALHLEDLLIFGFAPSEGHLQEVAADLEWL